MERVPVTVQRILERLHPPASKACASQPPRITTVTYTRPHSQPAEAPLQRASTTKASPTGFSGRLPQRSKPTGQS